MRLLAIDTAWEASSVAVMDGERMVVRSENIGRGHAEILMRQIEAAMAAAALAVADLDRIAVTVGPGSFTGLRIGIAAARGIALVTGKPAIGVGVLAAHAAEVRQTAPVAVLAVLAAGRGELYGQRFAADGTPLDEPHAAPPEVFAANLDRGEVLAGSGADLVIAALPMDEKPRVAHRRSSPDVSALARLAALAPASASPPRPLYIRPPDARPQDAARIARR
ncbi:MAG TPA: tRNA (adenosine(37)-N6)-threonylcarbamoyltransferase complex dimerization subunit type 1 TsaB [Bauldia sp.]|nr:tRNA (adenosine(37)-N6)-threonylcarbamoyltransferase complex dimerization subunit type 1 TsaB [Bauldia sp.]